MRAQEGESREIGVGEALGLEEIDGGEDVVDGVGERELLGAGLGVNNAQNFEVTEVLAVGCTELEVNGIRIRVCRKGARRRTGARVRRNVRERRKRKRVKHFLVLAGKA